MAKTTLWIKCFKGHLIFQNANFFFLRLITFALAHRTTQHIKIRSFLLIVLLFMLALFNYYNKNFEAKIDHIIKNTY